MAARTSLKLRMAAVVAVAALALLVLLVTGAITSARVEDHLASIRGNHLPRIGLQPRLEGHFERIGRGLQDAVAASDVDMLADTRQLADRFTGELAAAGDAVDPQAAAALRQAVADYYGAAYRVSERLIAGETGEALIDAIADMQERQGRAAERLKQATEIDQDGLARSFAAARQAQREATRIQLVVSGVCLLLVIVLSVGISRSILRSVSDLTAGFARFGDGDFSRPIPTAADELGEVARQANHMAERLDRLRSERDRIDRDLRQKNEELTRAAAELSRASTYKSQFLANMSHELRTPLNAILGFAELLHDGAVSPDSPEHKEFLGDILTSGRHLLQLINDVLDLSKVEAGKLEFRPEEAELGRLIGEVVAILRTTAAEKRIRIATEVAPEVDRVTLDPARLKQVLYNYVSNALKFTPEGGRVAIRALPEGDERFRLEVEDTGIGVAEEDLPRLFVEFQQ
ncbi:MAG TPA: histidine kinase dimerization/phospho-acceptor domain-containing protein, partial [Kofleriaceae bacterium]|nr:histidine kinase dimerization/phospho-acceptor domain-containing protein [Kofleriaceae bacterium]